MGWWIGIAIAFVLILGLFLLGIYLIVRKIGNKVADVPKDVVEKGFGLLKEKLSKKDDKK